MKVSLRNPEETTRLAVLLGKSLVGGEVFELVGDVGSGKTTFTKGLAEGMGVEDDVQSPSFTISRTYQGRDGLELHHYDFYRLFDPGIMRYDLAESTEQSYVVTVVEWAETVADVLPQDRTTLVFAYDEDNPTGRMVAMSENKATEEAYAAWCKN